MAEPCNGAIRVFKSEVYRRCYVICAGTPNMADGMYVPLAEFERLKADAERGEWMVAHAWFPAAFEADDSLTIDPHSPTNSENGRDAARQAIDALRSAAETGGSDE